MTNTQSLQDWGQRIQTMAQQSLARCKDALDIGGLMRFRNAAADRLSRLVRLPEDYLDSVYAADHGFQTPRFDVRTAVFNDGRILLVRDRSTDRWCLPGRFTRANESMWEAAQAELETEVGVRVRPVRIAAVFDHRAGDHVSDRFSPGFRLPEAFYQVYLLCDLLGGYIRTDNEKMEAGLFHEQEVRRLRIDPTRTTAFHLRRMFEFNEDPFLLPDFD